MGPTWPYVDVDLRNAIEKGVVPGPRLMVAGNYVSSTGGAGDARQFLDLRGRADRPEPRRRTRRDRQGVRTNFKNGADFVKILVTGAVTSKGIGPEQQQYSDAEIQAAVDEARRWGRRVAAHAHGTAGIKAALRAGVWTIDHGSLLDAEAIETLKEGRPGTCRRCTSPRRCHRTRSCRRPRGALAKDRRDGDRVFQAGAPRGAADRPRHRRSGHAARASTRGSSRSA
jgi:imidazolonepropionase-like amidohydrolase